MSTLDATESIQINKNVSHTEIDDELVILGEDCVYHSLNSIGAEIWKLLSKGPTNLEKICQQLLQEYAVEKEQCVSEVKQFVGELLEKKMLEKQ